MEDMVKLMERVYVNGLVTDDRVYLTESEVKESLDNYLKVFGNLDNESYYDEFRKSIRNYGVVEREHEGIIYYKKV